MAAMNKNIITKEYYFIKKPEKELLLDIYKKQKVTLELKKDYIFR